MRIRRAVIDAMVAHARAQAPLECCGLLIAGSELIDACRPASNLRQSATAYEVDPRDHFAAIREARRGERQVVGAYHSHPASPAVPSQTDVAAAFDPEFIHVIVSLAGKAPDVRAYCIHNGNFREVSLVPVP